MWRMRSRVGEYEETDGEKEGVEVEEQEIGVVEEIYVVDEMEEENGGRGGGGEGGGGRGGGMRKRD